MTRALLAFALVAGLLTLLPGLDTALVLRSTATHGARAGLATAAGINLGVLTWGVSAAAGVSALLTASHLAYDALRLAGVAYLLWLGIRMLAQSLRPHPTEAAQGAEGQVAERQLGDPGDLAGRSAWVGLRRGLLTNLLNPKVGVFYLAVLPQFIPASVPRGAAHLAAGVALTLVHVVEGATWFAVLVGGVHGIRPWLRRPAARRGLDGAAGAALLVFATRLAVEDR